MPSPVDALAELIPEWLIALRPQNKASGTVDLYVTVLGMYLHWCDEHDLTPLAGSSCRRG